MTLQRDKLYTTHLGGEEKKKKALTTAAANVASTAAVQHCNGPNKSGAICDITIGTIAGSASYPREHHGDLV